MAKALQDDGMASAHQPASEAQVDPVSDREPWGLFEVFVLVQFLSPALLMFPGMQVLRMPIRVLPYAFSIFVFLILFQRRGSSAGPRAQALGHPAERLVGRELDVGVVDEVGGDPYGGDGAA